MTSKQPSLLSLPTLTELRGCWDLCRLSNPRLPGFWATWAPTAWSVFTAYRVQYDIPIQAVLKCLARYIPLCLGIQSLVMTVDDIMDYDIDIRVARTQARPIPRGAISPPRAWLFLFIQVTLGVYCARKFLDPTSLHLSMVTWPAIVVYPTCKRWTNLAPIPLAFMFNIGTYMGWNDINTSPHMDWTTSLLLHIAASLWTICYETIYQHQDRFQDEQMGIYSMARLFGTWTISLCTAAAMGFFLILGYVGVRGGYGPPFYCMITLVGLLVLRRLSHTDINNPKTCGEFFFGMPSIFQLVAICFAMDAMYHRLLLGIPL
ncbi:UbiA prenyltransferase [Dentipellis sp. KUC8613]|nr:UbiA prenyltransferase [Dentipellis sp. KUC8613]